ncbi:MAG: aminodeoxychorismate/anthranilate synthase component II [Magnetococcales bacterium]|nr:aminodeoxychorismate/anthranilate synthase component II [Magnetococcales bacterium]
MILMIDNFDSFTYNLVQYFGELDQEVQVFRNNAITLEEVDRLAPSHIVLSPGPCDPDQAGITLEVIRHCSGRFPILGVCLGHQAIGQAFGGKVIRAPYAMHGKTSSIHHHDVGVFSGLSNPFQATRYHSLVVDREKLPVCLKVTAWTDDGLIMGLKHQSLNVEGVQFHPESILTCHGHDLLRNFLRQ